ncbi:pseudaminic acid cytidylyltransferase [Bacteroides uniformis]|uniref:pseudaminic acid cytidylyltransferase n=1 Tax=Bacteroides uniformis TaxID=820 RepID=UPI00189C0039|nr:pseudaminic acid cytidylyltransferase [Bacteroides uniformis]
MKNIAIIPARGGSKRIPRKNIKSFLGKPIIAYSIEAALQSGLFDEVMVSTDDEEIAEIACGYGAKVPFMRSAETSNDYAGLADVIDEVIDTYKSQGTHFDNWCCVLSTAPFITSSLLIDAYDKFVNSGFDSLRPVVRFSYPVQRAFKMTDNGEVSFINSEYAATRSQDLMPMYHDAGLFYWGTVSKGFHGKRWGGLEIDEKVCQDIDTEEDWVFAEMKYKLLISK